ncbi:hypothetical protein KAH55_11520 [bacterium]|nr:hypothetical protein [bacterium]
MKKEMILFCLLLAVGLFMSCSETGTTTYQGAGAPKLTLQRQIPGCQGNALGKKTADNCFDYTFSDDSLKLEFCVTGNCCPDSNRFVLDSEFNGANLFVTVTDTAANLCRCICNYKVQAEYSHVTQSQYTVTCLLGDSILYRELIVRPE